MKKHKIFSKYIKPEQKKTLYELFPSIFEEGKIDKNNFIINNVVEKPSIKTSPSNNAVIGRYILPKTIFSKLKSLKPGKIGEFHITDAIQALIEDDNQFIGHNFSGKYLDCGTSYGHTNSTSATSYILIIV